MVICQPDQHDSFIQGSESGVNIEDAEIVKALSARVENGQACLERNFRSGEKAWRNIRLRSKLIDDLIFRLWKRQVPNPMTRRDLAIIAVGGYGRQELHPHSDIDILFLSGDSLTTSNTRVCQAILYGLWDSGLKVGHSIRTIAQCQTDAGSDICLLTNLMEGRHLIGHRALSEKLQAAISTDKIWPVEPYIKAKLEEQENRHKRYGSTVYNLEPNIKESPGGLRDIHTLIWCMQRQFGVGSLRALSTEGFLGKRELNALRRGCYFLWRLRCGLHYLAQRKEDRLVFDYQKSLAELLGYRDKVGAMAVEVMMKEYYRTVKELRLLNVVLIQNLSTMLFAKGRIMPKPYKRHFLLDEAGTISLRDQETFSQQPPAILELFLHLAVDPAISQVHSDTIRNVLKHLPIINSSFRRSSICRRQFMKIMRAPKGPGKALLRMNDYGVLGRYIPTFGRIVGQMQHDLFHIYTVDAHSLYVVNNLVRLHRAKTGPEDRLLHDIFRKLYKPERLYIAALFHDLAKGRGGDHSELGSKDVYRFCRDHQLTEFDSELASWLVRRHLVMSDYAQRKDISNPVVIHAFCEIVQDQERLDNLYLLTVADIKATSPKVWSNWKGKLLLQLYTSATRMLLLGDPKEINIENYIQRRKKLAMEILLKKQFSTNLVEKLWALLDMSFFYRNDPDGIAWQSEKLLQAGIVDLPLVEVQHEEAVGTHILVCAPASEQLLTHVTGGFEILNLSIAEARIHPVLSGFLLLNFFVPDSEIEAIIPIDVIARRLRDYIVNPDERVINKRQNLVGRGKHFPTKTQITFVEDKDGSHTSMEIEASDRPGLVYQVAKAMLHCKVRMLSAKITTIGSIAKDVFVLTDQQGQAVTNERQQECLSKTITSALDSPRTWV